MDWLLQDIHNIWLNHECWLIYGGIVSVGVTIFLMGLFKILIGNKIKSKMLRKTLLSFVSVVLVAPVTAGYLWAKTVSGMDYFWYIYLFNALMTIVVYWFYENTQVRELFATAGKKVLSKVISANMEKFKDSVDEFKETANRAEKSKYNEDDLTNL